MDLEEKRWFGILALVAIAVNALTLSQLVPWQRWLLWSRPTPDRRVVIDMQDYGISLPPEGIELQAGEYVEFVASSGDVTYGLGVFRPDGTLVFQMQVLPGHENRLVWKFDAPGHYDVRSTEYSGTRHPEMFFPGVIRVTS